MFTVRKAVYLIFIALLLSSFRLVHAQTLEPNCSMLNPVQAHSSNLSEHDGRYSQSNLKSSAAYDFCKAFVSYEMNRTDADNKPKLNTYPDPEDYPNAGFSLDKLSIWGTGRLMRGYLDMFEATKNTYFLDRFVLFADEFKDEAETNFASMHKYGLPDMKMYGWPEMSAGGTLPSVSVVHTGYVTYPLIRFVEIIERDPSLSSYNAKADDYENVVLNAINFITGGPVPHASGAPSDYDRFCEPQRGSNPQSSGYNPPCGLYSGDTKPFRDEINPNDDFHPKKDAAFFYWHNDDYSDDGDDSNDITDDKKAGWTLPNNQQLAVGATMAALWGLRGDEDDTAILRYKWGAIGLGRAFYRDTELKSTGKDHHSAGRYEWGYYWGVGEDNESPAEKAEDVGHVFTDIEYLLEMKRQGLNAMSSVEFPWEYDDTESPEAHQAQRRNKTLKRFTNSFTEGFFQNSYPFDTCQGGMGLAFRVNGEAHGNATEKCSFSPRGPLLADLSEWDVDFHSTCPSDEASDCASGLSSSIPNKAYSIAKCSAYEDFGTTENAQYQASGILGAQGAAKLAKWAAILNDNDTPTELSKRCNALKGNNFYQAYIAAFVPY